MNDAQCITFDMERAECRALDALARKDGAKRAELIRRAIHAYLGRRRKRRG